MKSFIQPGDALDLTAPYDVASGAGFLVGSIFAVATISAANGADIIGRTTGVYDLAKAAGAVTQGAKLYWDNTNKVLTTTASGNTLVGTAVRAAQSGDATARVRLGIVA
ncbi:DUF2190 family protein [Rhizorhabdus histidinilytica]|uniref:DUF2190 family protein n=1 Tax=Rhizorhabdus histidinilytica TaxID=439228 RepID=UPI00321FF762